MKKELKRGRIIEIVNNFSEFENLTGVELVSRLVENVSLLEAEKAKIDRVIKKLEFSKEYNDEYSKLLREEAVLNEDGNFKFVSEGQIELKDAERFKLKFNEFETKFKDEIERVSKEREAFNSYMEESVTFDFKKIEKNLLPPDISLKHYKLLTEML